MEHIAVAQLVASFTRVLRYDRAGYGSSTFRDGVPEKINVENRGKELTLLLEAIRLPPPYILVGQSYGGTIIREFLEQRGPVDIVGMVFVDTIPIRHKLDELEAMLGDLTGGDPDKGYGEATGLAANMILTPEQEAQIRADSATAEKNGTVAAEIKAIDDSQLPLNTRQGVTIETDEESGWIRKLAFTKQPLGKGRISVIHGDVIRDVTSLVTYGKKHGYGDEELYKKAEDWVKNCKMIVFQCQEAQSHLTAGETRVIKAPGTGRTHNLNLTRPDIVFKEIEWVMAGVWDMTEHYSTET